MMMTKRNILLIFSSLLIYSSCIKEERIECPCFLSIDFSLIDTLLIDNVNIWLADSQNNIFLCDTLSRENFTKFYEVAVPKGATHLYCWGNINNSTIKDEEHPSIITPEGASSDKLYFFSTKIDTSDEFGKETVKMKRYYTGIFVKVSGEASADEGVKLEIKSSSTGYYISGKIYEGIYSCHRESYSDCLYDFNIIKQKTPEDLIISLYTMENGIEEKVTEFPLGAALNRVGIDMSGDKMGDVFITIDYSSMSAKVTVENWQNTTHTEIII